MNVGAQTVTGGGVAILLIGSNGLTLDPQGRLIITAMTDRSVVRLEKDGTRTVLADRYQGKRFNGPNDIVGKSDGAIYFTDTVWGMRGAEKSPDRELPYSGFFLIKDGKVTLLGEEKDSDTPNGIALSPDEKHLVCNGGLVEDHALRCAARRHGGESGEVLGRWDRRHQSGSERQRVFHRAGQRDLDYFA